MTVPHFGKITKPRRVRISEKRTYGRTRGTEYTQLVRERVLWTEWFKGYRNFVTKETILQLQKFVFLHYYYYYYYYTLFLILLALTLTAVY